MKVVLTMKGWKKKLELGKEKGSWSKVGQWEKRKMNIFEESSSSQIPNYRKTEMLQKKVYDKIIKSLNKKYRSKQMSNRIWIKELFVEGLLSHPSLLNPLISHIPPTFIEWAPFYCGQWKSDHSIRER